MNVERRLADDLLVGANLIGKFLGLPPRVVYHAAARGHLPIFKLGPKLAARKSELRAKLSADTSSAEVK